MNPDRLPPHDLPAEKALIGSAILEPDRIESIATIIGDGAFFQPDHDVVWPILRRMHADGKRIDGVTLRAELEAAGVLEEVGGAAYIATLLSAVPSAAHAEHYARIVAAHARARAAIAIGQELVEKAYQPDDGLAAEDAIARAADRLATIAQAAGDGPKICTAAELIERNPTLPPPLIDGLIRIGEIGNCIGSPKLGKTLFVTQAGLCVAAGAVLFGRQCTKARVLIVDGELRPGVHAERLRRVAIELGMADALEGIDVLCLRGCGWRLGDLMCFLLKIPPGTYGLIILDPLYRVLAGLDENDNLALTGVYDDIDRAATRLGAAVILIHHASKGDQSGKDTSDMGAGAGAQSRAVDVHMAIRPHEQDDCFVVDAICRSWRQPDPFVIERRYPVFILRDDLDPAAIRRGSRRRKAEATGDTAIWTPATFADAFLTADPQGKDTIVLAAEARGIKPGKAGQLLRASVDAGKAHEFRPRDRRAAVRYANRPATVSEA